MSEGLWTVGFHAVLAVLESDQPVDALWLQQDRRDQRAKKIIAAARRRGIRFDVVPRARLDRVSDGVVHNGCAVRSAPVAFVDLEDLLAVEGRSGADRAARRRRRPAQPRGGDSHRRGARRRRPRDRRPVGPAPRGRRRQGRSRSPRSCSRGAGQGGCGCSGSPPRQRLLGLWRGCCRDPAHRCTDDHSVGPVPRGRRTRPARQNQVTDRRIRRHSDGGRRRISQSFGIGGHSAVGAFPAVRR